MELCNQPKQLALTVTFIYLRRLSMMLTVFRQLDVCAAGLGVAASRSGELRMRWWGARRRALGRFVAAGVPGRGVEHGV